MSCGWGPSCPTGLGGSVDRVLHVGSPFTLFICPAHCRRLQRQSAHRLALLLGWSTAPRKNLSSWTADSPDSVRIPQLPPLPVAAAPAVGPAHSAAAGLLVCWLAAATRLALSEAIRSSSACSFVPCNGWPYVQCSCTSCMCHVTCGADRPKTAALLASPSSAVSPCLLRQLHQSCLLLRRFSLLLLLCCQGCCFYLSGPCS